ncbi:sphingomyelin phosphodiesterase 4-like isoform X2 [Pomacea canaliculata]|uniref:sphingomyelin phosphodiesterase 4-like isoform X2 n=1 Tax=Pomacea canaliculata TaxID=400727 RepID=UPI000D73BD5C|nr:sphingomyelin phosphodiesterase 4-like isoform X2 [Pomacea canaliculata]
MGKSTFCCFSYQIQSLQGKPLQQKCIETEDLIKRTSTKELRLVLPILLQNIFGFENEPGWGLDKVSKIQDREAFVQIRHLLSPEGPLLTLVYNLQMDPYTTYEFPLKCLPNPSRRTIEEGGVPVFYINKLQAQGLAVPSLLLNSFELYMFHFAYALVSPQWQQTGASWPNLFDFLYPILVDDYLVAFLPLGKWVFQPLPHMPAPVRSSVSQVPVTGRQASGHVSFSPPRFQRTSLFKSGCSLTQKQHAQSSPVLENTEAETWRSETMLQTFVEFWLNQNSLTADLPGYVQGIMHHCLKSDPFSYLFEHFMPSPNQVKIVRLLVKYLHYFANSAMPMISSPYQHHVENPLDNFKRSVIPQILQKKLYWFLRHAFDRWPLDCHFRMVLETWLSYIQPWRYTDISHFKNSKSLLQTEREKLEQHIHEKWDQFIEDNLLFYTVLFQEFLPRVYRMDLTSPQSAYMLFRVTKVFSTPNLASLILKAENELLHGMEIPLNRTAELGGSYLSSSHYQPAVFTLPPHLTDMEVSGFHYHPLFSDNIRLVMNDIMQKILQAQTALQASIKNVTVHQQSGCWLWSWLFSDDKVDGVDTKRVALYLEHAVGNICNIFKLRKPEGFCSYEGTHSLANDSTLDEDDGLPDHELTETGPKLTPFGKYQVINNLRHFQNWQLGDPDMQPICSYENAVLVRLLFHICTIINNNFEKQILQLYERPDFLGRVAKVFLAPPIAPSQPIQSPVSRETAMRLRRPRVSLRFLAAYQNLFLLGILYVITHMWLGTGPIGFIFFLGCVFALYGMLRAATSYSR